MSMSSYAGHTSRVLHHICMDTSTLYNYNHIRWPIVYGIRRVLYFGYVRQLKSDENHTINSTVKTPLLKCQLRCKIDIVIEEIACIFYFGSLVSFFMYLKCFSLPLHSVYIPVDLAALFETNSPSYILCRVKFNKQDLIIIAYV